MGSGPGDEVLIAFADAVARCRREAGYCNAYSTLRADAARRGRVYLGKDMAAQKDRSRWAVRRSDLEAGIAAELSRRAEQAEAAAHYERHVLRGADSEQVLTTWGYYSRRGPFPFVRHNPYSIREEMNRCPTT